MAIALEEAAIALHMTKEKRAGRAKGLFARKASWITCRDYINLSEVWRRFSYRIGREDK